MTAPDMILEFRSQTRLQDSALRSTIGVPRIVALLNEAQLKVLTNKYGPLNTYLMGFEANQKRIQEFERIHIIHAKSSVATSVDNERFHFNLKPDVMYITRVSFKGSQGSCADKALKGFYLRSDDFNEGMENTLEKPSFEWRAANFRYSQKQIVGYSDGKFNLSLMDYDYLRYPQKIDVGGYKGPDNVITQRQDCELPEILHLDIVQQAAMLAMVPVNPSVAGTLNQVSRSNE